MASGRRQVGFYLLLLMCVVVPLFALGLSNHGLWTPDEPRVAEIGREMALSGNWFVPTLNQKPFLEEPPLYYAALGAVFRISGKASDKIVRIPSALFAFGGVLALFFLANQLMGPRIAFMASFIMATCGEYFRVAHWVVVDSALTFFVLLALAFFIRAYVSQIKGRRFLFYGICYISCVFAFYAKGFIGIVIPGLAILSFLAFRRDFKEVIRMRLWFGVAVFLVMTAPWFFELWRQGGWEFLRVFLIYNHVGRFAGGESGHHQPIYYYLSQFPAGFLPWSLLVIPVIYRVAKRNADLNGSERMGVLFAVCWFISGFVFLSIASTKRVLYLMPLFAPASLLTAWFLDLTLKGVRVRRFEGVFMRLFGLIPMILGVAAVPLYLHFCRVYDFAWSWRTGGWIITFSLISVVFAVEALCRHRESMKHFWSLSSVSVLSLLLLSLLAVIPLLDRYKSFVPFCRDINAVVPGKAPLYAYQPDETLRGAVPFYTGRHLDEVETLDVLSEIGKKRQSVFVAVRDKRGNLEREILGTSRFSVITRRGADKDRSLVLFKSGTAGSYEESW